MENTDLIKSPSTSLLDKGIDAMRDSNSSRGTKAGAVALVAIGAVVALGTTAMKIIGQDKK